MQASRGCLSSLVSGHWLAKSHTSVRTIDASWFLNSPRDPKKEFLARHVPGAVFWPIDEISDTSSTTLPHMMPSESDFNAAMSAFGLSEADDIVVYDTHLGATRVWLTLKAFGHKGQVRILQGGLTAYRGTLESGPAIQWPQTKYQSGRLNPKFIIGMAELDAGLENGTIAVLDARPAPRFEGTQPEPRPTIRSGHMPGALNIPWPSLFDDNHQFKSQSELAQILAPAIEQSRTKRLVTSCGSGMTATLINFALQEIGFEEQVVALYDGSWAEWGNKPIH
jgi:thiosulfate/3-mercaptopyruvate sulfurtransferase